MIAASMFSYEDVCKDMGFSIFVQLYIRVRYTPKCSSPEQSYRTGVIDGGEYYIPRTSTQSSVHYDLDREQKIALAFSLYHYNIDNPSLHNMRKELFLVLLHISSKHHSCV